MPNSALAALINEIGEDRRVSAEEALQLREQIFPDSIVSRDEAEAVVALNARVRESDPAWEQAFIEAILDYALGEAQYPGHVRDERAVWLAALPDGRLETLALLKVLERCDSAPASLYQVLRDRLAAMIAAAPVSSETVELLRRCLFAGDGFVSEDEARWLFALDAATDGRANDPAWTDLFVKAQLCHLMGRQPDLPDQETMLARQKWLADTSIHPLSNLGHMFDNGFSGFRAKATTMSERGRLETYYEAANANAEEDAALTSAEQDWALDEAHADGKLTANERALLTELDKIKASAAA